MGDKNIQDYTYSNQDAVGSDAKLSTVTQSWTSRVQGLGWQLLPHGDNVSWVRDPAHVGRVQGLGLLVGNGCLMPGIASLMETMSVSYIEYLVYMPACL